MSVLLSIGGIVLISYADGFLGTTAVGIALSIGAAIGSAIYKVTFSESSCLKMMLTKRAQEIYIDKLTLKN